MLASILLQEAFGKHKWVQEMHGFNWPQWKGV